MRQRLANRLQRTEGDRDDLKADLQKQRKAAAIAQTQASDAEKLAHALRETNKGLELELMAQRSQARAWQASNPESNLQRIRELSDEVRRLQATLGCLLLTALCSFLHLAVCFLFCLCPAVPDQVRLLSEARAVQAHEAGVLTDRLRIMGREVDDQLDALVRANRRADEAEARAGSLGSVHAGLQMELDSLRAQAVELTQLRAQNRELNDRILALSRQFEEASATLPSVAAEHDALAAEVGELKRAAATLESRHARERAEQSALHAAELAQRASTIDALRAELRELPRARSDAADAQAALRAAHAEHAREREHERKASDALAAERARAAADEASALRARIGELERTNAELNALIEKPRAQAAELQRMRERETEMRAVVTRLIKAEEATEPAFTCLSCTAIYRSPVTCIPCGHSFCLQCIEATGHCSQCGPKVQVSYYPNDLLEQLTSKYVSRKQALASLRLMDQSQMRAEKR